MRTLSLYRIGLLSAMLLACAHAGADHLLLTYIEKPPLYYTDSAGNPAGVVLERVQAALTGHTFSFQSRSPRRAIEEIRANRVPTCSIGWFKTPERESFAVFSAPILQDAPMLAVVRATKHDSFRDHANLGALLAVPKLRVGVVAGFSYGPKLDDLLRPLGDRLDVAPSVSTNLRKLVAWRVDAVLVNAEELDYYLKEAQIRTEDIVPLRFPDMPPGEYRYLMCNRKTPPALIQQFNSTLPQVKDKSRRQS